MHWVFIAVIVIALLALATRSPKIAFSTLAVLIVAVAGFYWLDESNGNKSRQMIASEVVAFSLHQVQKAYADSYDFTMRIHNKSTDRSLRSIELIVVANDCLIQDGNETCTVLGEVSDRITITIPPGQSRDVKRNLHFGRLVTSNTLKWDYRINKVIAQ